MKKHIDNKLFFFNFLDPRLREGHIILSNYAKKKPAGIARILVSLLAHSRCFQE
jgi:hypothetical protein